MHDMENGVLVMLTEKDRMTRQLIGFTIMINVVCFMEDSSSSSGSGLAIKHLVGIENSQKRTGKRFGGLFQTPTYLREIQKRMFAG
jgi:hypothetical protein